MIKIATLLFASLLLFSGCGDETPTKSDFESRDVVNNAGEIVKLLVVNAGETQSVHLGTKVNLTAASSDGTGKLRYSWKLTSKPTNSTATLSDTSVIEPSFTPDLGGEYILELTVIDSENKRKVTTVTINVGNSAPTANAGANKILHISNGVVELNASASSDSDGDSLTYLWSITSSVNGSNTTLSDANTSTPTFSADLEGVYTLSLVVNDGYASSLVSTVNISLGNSVPIANAGANQVLHISNNIVALNASASSDNDGNSLTYLWSIDSSPDTSSAVLSDATSVNPIFIADLEGDYNLTLVVNDGYVSSAISKINIFVTNTKPTANAGANKTVKKNTPITLNGSGSDSDGDNLTYSWVVASSEAGSSVTFTGTSTTSPTFSADLDGSYTLSLVVHDGYTSSIADTVNISIGVNLWKQISSGDFYSIGIKYDGTLWGWGYNASYRIDGSEINRLTPVRIGTASNWVSVSSSATHSVAINSDGKIYAWGSNTYGQLGNGQISSSMSPVQENTYATDWASVSAGWQFTVAIKTNGEIWTWGLNQYGQHALGTEDSDNTHRAPSKSLDGNWTSVSAGTFHIAAIKDDGTMWTWGKGGSGQLGHGLSTNSSVPVQENTKATNWVAVSAGHLHNIALNSLGDIYTFGANTYGQIGDGSSGASRVPKQLGSDKNWTSVSAGYDMTLAKSSTSELWATGSNTYGQLGDNTLEKKKILTKVDTNATNWLILSSGRYFNIVSNSDGELWSWGRNGFGELGTGSIDYETSPKQELLAATDWLDVGVGKDFSVGLKDDGTLWTWGNGQNFALGDGTAISKNAPTQIASDKNWTKIAVCDYYALALDTNNILWAWGSNSYGRLGTGNTISQSTPLRITGDADWESISASIYHSAAIKNNGTLWL